MLFLFQIKAKVNLVQGQYMEQLQKADKKFIDLQAHERNTGSGLIFSKKGKPISDKVHSATILNIQIVKFWNY